MSALALILAQDDAPAATVLDTLRADLAERPQAQPKEYCVVCHHAGEPHLGYVDDPVGPVLCLAHYGRAVHGVHARDISERHAFYDAFLAEVEAMVAEADAAVCLDCGGDCKAPCRPEPEGCHEPAGVGA